MKEFQSKVEAEVLVDLICHDYPNVKFWVAFQCKVSVKRDIYQNTNKLKQVSLIKMLI